MSVLSQQAIAQVQNILVQWNAVLGGAPLAGGGKALETFVALEIARTIWQCARHPTSATLRNGVGAIKNTYVARGAPGRIHSLGPPEPTSIRIGALRPGTGQPVELEIHQSVQWWCRLGALHELDVCVIQVRDPTSLKDRLGKARRLLGVECKQWARPADLGVGRQALALRHLLLTRRQAVVTTGARNKKLATFLSGAGPRYAYYSARPPGKAGVVVAPLLLGMDVVNDAQL